MNRNEQSRKKKMINMRWRRLLWLISVLVMMCNIMSPVSAEEGQAAPRVLFLSSYSYSWPTIPLQIQGISSVLGETADLDVEFLDTKKIQDVENLQNMKNTLAYKIRTIGKYDAVIVGDDAALHFADDNYDELFSGTPVVFEAVNNIPYAKEVGKSPDFTGVVEQISYSANIEFALKIQPDAKNIVAIVDDTVTGKAEQEQFLENRDNYPQLTFETLNASTMSYSELKEKIASFHNDTILLYLILSEDREGNVYTNSQVCGMLKETAQIPVYRYVQAGIGEGVLGGNIVLHEKSGEIAAEMVHKILNGTSAADIPVECESPNAFYLDENIIKKFNISSAVIPADAIIVNHKASFLEKHGSVLLGAAGIAFFAILIITFATKSMMDRKREKELSEKNQELAAALEAAKIADDSKSRFLAQTSHEIRTPLNIIIGLTGLAKDETENPKQIRDYLNKIEGSSKILLGLINNILDMSAISDGKMKIDKSEFDFRTQLTNLTVMFYQQSQNKNIRFDVHLKGVTEEHLIGDSLRLNQVLMNILSNAMKFTPAGGQVILSIVQASASRDRVHMRFIIKDTGSGMSKDMQERLFKPFEQQDSSTARKHGGSGLGMAITKNLVTLMGGTIRVASEVGAGTEFTVDIPFDRAESNSNEREKLIQSFSSYRALIVADSEETCHERGFCLEDMGLTYDVATDEEMALDMIGQAEEDKKPYRICVVDWKLSNSGGERFISDVREIFGEEMIIIGVAFDFAKAQAGGKKAGANYMVGKPVFRSTLFDAMMRISEGKIDNYDLDSENTEYHFDGKKVLIAEDVALNMEVAVKLLKRVGLQVTCVENGKEAIDIFKEKPENYFDCIFLDINMPVLDGYGAARGIRQSGKKYASTVPIYAMTANAFTSDVSEALDAGMDGHIAKPIETNVLYSTLDSLFSEK